MWKLETAHKFGELIASIAVIISLLFVGYEVKQNSEAQIQANTRSVIAEYTSRVLTISNVEGMACIYAKGMADYSSLSGEHRAKFSAFMLSTMYTLEELHYLAESGSVEQRIWRGLDRNMREVTALPGFKQWFETRRHWFSDEFQSYNDRLMQDSASRVSVTYTDADCTP